MKTQTTETRCFKIIRSYAPHLNRAGRTIKQHLTEAEAKAHCQRPETRQTGVWFDGYDYMEACQP